MAFTTQIEPGGRITLPPNVLEKLDLHEGDDIWVDDGRSEDEPTLSVEAAPVGVMLEEDGLLVWASPGPYEPGLDRQVLEAIRTERDLQALGVVALTLD